MKYISQIFARKTWRHDTESLDQIRPATPVNDSASLSERMAFANSLQAPATQSGGRHGYDSKVT
jgi:hypothetical protein